MAGSEHIDPDLFENADIVYRSERTVIRRLVLSGSGTPVVLKESVGRRAARRSRHERGLLERLRGVNGVPAVLDAPSPPGTLLLVDACAPTLATRLGGNPFPVADVFDLALRAAEVLAAVHRRGVVHRDVTPANLLVGDDGTVHLIDFDLGTEAAEVRLAFRHHSEIAGTLAYLAPEQTGRTGRAIDHRADLYGLGATLYEALTGTPPFGDEDPLQLVHDHLTRTPVPPAERDPAVPRALSAIVLRLLAKEPDERYQSAQGLAHDLATAREVWHAGRRAEVFPLGERDFPARLTAPSRLFGREPEIAVLARAFEEVLAGGHRTVVVSGAPGVGKSALLNEVRSMVTRAGGLFVTGKFDQFGQDQGADAVQQALIGVARLLLAEPDDVVVAVRSRLRERLGGNAGLAAAALPEFAALLDVAPEPSDHDPLLVTARLHQIALDVLQVVASPGRPVVLAIDDVQWATGTPLGTLDALQMDERLSGVLVLASYRHTEVDAAHPLTALLARWERLGVPPRRVHLDNLPATAVTGMLQEVLRLDPSNCAALASVVSRHTDGNPFDTIALLNGLRDDNLLTLGERGWQWEAGPIERYIGRGDVTDLLLRRTAALPSATTALLDVMSCLGGEVTTEVLATASGQTPEAVDDGLGPALQAGLLALDQASGTVAFRHDRVQQVALARLEPAARTGLQLQVARRLATAPQTQVLAAEPYLHALPAVQDAGERNRIVHILRGAAARTRLVANHPMTERYLAAAVDLLAPGRPAPDQLPDETRPLIARLAAEHHAALYSLGRLEDADAVFAWLEHLTDDPLTWSGAAQAQVSSLTNRNQPQLALDLTLRLMAELGVPVPAGPEEFGASIGPDLAALYQWAHTTSVDDDLARPEYHDPRLVAVARTIDHGISAALFSGQQLAMTWMILQAGKLWAEHGPTAALAGPLAHASMITIAIREDYAIGYTILRHVLAVSEARGYEPDTSRARFTYALSSSAWFEPLEESVAHAQRSHEGLVHGGDVHFAGATGYAALPPLLDCAPTLDDLEAQAQTLIAFCRRTGNDQAAAAYVAYRQFARALRGDTMALDSFTDADFSTEEHEAALATNPVAAANYHATRALAAALIGHSADLVRHAGAVMPLMQFIHSTYLMTAAHLMQGLALAHRLRTEPDAADRAARQEELGSHRDWLAGRATDAPGNYRHLLDAERAWAAGDFTTAARSYDNAQHGVSQRRPWHRALILERTGRFYLDHGVGQVGTLMLSQAHASFDDWGAAATARALTAAHPELRSLTAGPAPDLSTRVSLDTRRSQTIASDDLDLVGILRAAQALGSQTDLDQLRDTVIAVLSALSGASGVQLALWSDDAQDWFVPLAGPDGRVELTLAEAAAQALLPLSAFRYAERTRQPLTVDDAGRDDRFARDPYLAGLDTCSLLVLPVLTRGLCKAMLILENRTTRAAFSPDRQDGVMLIAGQLAVSLDNAMLSASLENRVAQRVRDLDAAHEHLLQLSNTDALTGLANRRHLDDVLRAQWERAVAHHSPLSLVMIDIDLFKKYNDGYGHQAGDQCLRTVAAAVRETVRDTDLVARYGGEEFTIVLPNTDSATAARIAQRARAAVAALALPHVSSPHGIVTISVGTASVVPGPSDTPERLLEAADQRLYAAKHQGRNRVVAG